MTKVAAFVLSFCGLIYLVSATIDATSSVQTSLTSTTNNSCVPSDECKLTYSIKGEWFDAPFKFSSSDTNSPCSSTCSKQMEACRNICDNVFSKMIAHAGSCICERSSVDTLIRSLCRNDCALMNRACVTGLQNDCVTTTCSTSVRSEFDRQYSTTGKYVQMCDFSFFNSSNN